MCCHSGAELVITLVPDFCSHTNEPLFVTLLSIHACVSPLIVLKITPYTTLGKTKSLMSANYARPHCAQRAWVR